MTYCRSGLLLILIFIWICYPSHAQANLKSGNPNFDTIYPIALGGDLSKVFSIPDTLDTARLSKKQPNKRKEFYSRFIGGTENFDYNTNDSLIIRFVDCFHSCWESAMLGKHSVKAADSLLEARVAGFLYNNYSRQLNAEENKIITCLISRDEKNTAPDSMRFGPQERVLLGEIFRLRNEFLNDVWPGWSKAPIAFLLVTGEHEFLMHHPRPSNDFTFFIYDEAIGDSVYVRKRQFSPNLRATFPAVGGVPTIVMGLPDSTESPTDWLLTALHEHFHQWQMSQPDYFGAVNNLGLSGGDNTGQWMLNYPFTYDSTIVQQHFTSLADHLKTALESIGKPYFSRHMERYLKAREEFHNVLNPDDYRYFSFQVWQEGVARYVEYKMATAAAGQYTPSEAFQSLEGYKPFANAAADMKDRILNRLSKMSLQKDERTAFYPIGAAEGLLLDEVNPDWQQRYWEEKFYLERLFNIEKK